MRDSQKFRKYAEECRRLAKHMKPEQRATLLEIAEAWVRCAEQAERGNGEGEQGDPSDEPVTDGGAMTGKRNQAARAPPESERM